MEAVNRPGALPDLDQGWQAVVRLELKEVSYTLVREYEREMEEALEKEKLPVKQEWLMGIHHQILSGKKSILKENICCINPLHSSDKEVELLLDQLEQGIVQWSKQCENEETRQVVGGSLLQFTTLNFSMQLMAESNIQQKNENEETRQVVGGSLLQFTTLNFSMQLMAESNIQQKVTEALRNSQPLDITAEVDTIVAEYEEKSLGPASSEILDKGLSEIEQLTSILKKIPGRPRDVWIIGQSTDRIKLSWMPPEHNPDAVEEYVVYKKDQDGEWKEFARTKNTKALVKGIKWMTTHEFQVVATNSTVTSISSGETSESIFPTSLAPNQRNTARPCSCSSWQRVTFNKKLLKHCEILNHLILRRKLTQLLQNMKRNR